jgi:2-polyprenyl-3-methyl-5-hydroxy-6-metoxy-1,4-benzoquinol methylase
MSARQVRETFAVDDATVVALPSAGLNDGSSQDRYAAWRATLDAAGRSPVEYLLPRIEIDITDSAPGFMVQRGHLDATTEEIAARVDAIGPWDVPFRLGHDVCTMAEGMVAAVARRRFWYRVELINGVISRLLGDELARSTVLDVGCHSGLFSLDLAARGAAVDGVDLRPQNIAQATFLAEHYGIDNVTFEVRDADDLAAERTWDVVLNLGLLYHVLNPFELIELTYSLCGSFAVIDTVCHTEPVSAFLVMGDKDVVRSSEGKAAFELHPTYRAVIDTMRGAGFSELFEVVGRAERPHDLYATGNRRCFLAIK